MKVLVTGATGMVGAELVQQLLADGAEVRVLRRGTSQLDLLSEADASVEHHIGDVTDAHSVLAAIVGVAQVYHVAAYIGFGGRREEKKLHRINVGGTANVVNAALKNGVQRVVHTSSLAAFGRPPQPEGLIDETSAWRDSQANTEYAYSKYLSELEIHRGIAEGLDAVIVNPALIFGVGRSGENTRLICERVRDGKIPAIPVGGTNVVDVRDVAEGHRLAMQRGRTGERYFLGSENLRWKTIMGTLAEAFGVQPPARMASPRLAEVLGTVAETFARLTFTTPKLTRELAQASARFYPYTNRKAVEELGCTFRPFAETAQHIAEALQQA